MSRLRCMILTSLPALLVAACATGHLGVVGGGGGNISGESMLPGGGVSFLGSFSAPLWVVLIINLATLISAGVNAWAVFRVAPKTALQVAEKQAEVAREAVSASAASATAAREAAMASTNNAATAARSAENQGIHAVARLRQEWINELRGRIAQAHSLLSNREQASASHDGADKTANDSAADLKYRREANEAVAKIELLLNMEEPPAQALMAAIRRLEKAGALPERQAAAREVVTCGQAVLKEEWDRVREELTGVPRRVRPALATRPTV